MRHLTHNESILLLRELPTAHYRNCFCEFEREKVFSKYMQEISMIFDLFVITLLPNEMHQRTWKAV